ncbi:MAG: TraB/GumN family protein [Flavobacteriales bacterium]|nr:TraB/GumN family protein [Flavobacteriales bacterium]
MKYIKQLGWALLLLPSLFAFKKQEVASEKDSLFWEISGKGLEQSSYLYGTIHMINKKDFFLPEIVEEKFKACQVLALEIDLDLTMAQKIDMAVKTLLPDNKTVADFMDSTAFQELRRYMIDDVGIKDKKADKYMHLKPFFLSSVILTEQLGDIKSYDEEFMDMAKKNKMEMMGLESIDYQFNLIDNVSIEDQIKLLLDGIKEEDGQNQFDQMVEMYKNQQLNDLYELTISESGDIENFKTDFLDTRNSNWIPIIEESIKEKSVFIAVGAGHLAGTIGVIALLEAQGYSVKPLRD